MFKRIDENRKKGLKIGFTSSTFDLLHAGHCAMLQEARSLCDFLIVGLLVDPSLDRSHKNKPVQSVFERWLQASSIEFVDMIIPFDSEKDLEDLLKVIMPDIRFCGEEYKDVDHTGRNIEGIHIHYNKRRHSFSSSELRDRVAKANKIMES